MSNNLISIDIVSSALNEAENISKFYTELDKHLDKSKYDWKLLIADNGSVDDTWAEICSISRQYNNVQGFRMARNFGFEYSISAVLSQSNADATIIMASDLQDHPRYLEIFLESFSSGADHVFQVVQSRPDINFARKFLTKQFYSLANFFSNGAIVPNAGDFRLFSRRFRNALLQMKENTRLLRAMASYPGFKSIGVNVPREARTKGKSKMNFSHVISLGVKGILSNSIFLLDAIALFSIVFAFVVSLLTIVFAILWIVFGVPFAGYGTIVGSILVGFSLIFLIMGVLAQYVSLIYTEVKNRPTYFISEITP